MLALTNINYLKSIFEKIPLSIESAYININNNTIVIEVNKNFLLFFFFLKNILPYNFF